jgi:hypothetical protein
MNKALLTTLLFLAITPAAHAQCASISPGFVAINHRTGTLVGRNFYARLSCSRNSPVLVLWRGGSMCAGRYFYGRSAAGSFSCLVRALGRR